MIRTAAIAGAAAGASATIAWHHRHVNAPAVARWRPSNLDVVEVGPLHVRTGGDGEATVVLLHGLVASGDIFGLTYDQLAEHSHVVVPDLLGFGRSLDEGRDSFEIEDHLAALDNALTACGLDDRPLIIGAHSMGSAIACAWAAQRGAQVKAVVCWGAPVYADRNATASALADTGVMARLFAGSNRLAQHACHLSCRHRFLAGWAAAAASPSLPVPVARMASLHTWPAYRDAMDAVLATTDWDGLATSLADNGTHLSLTWGTEDRIGDRDLAESLPGADICSVPHAGHHLPLTHPEFCVQQLRSSLDQQR